MSRNSTSPIFKGDLYVEILAISIALIHQGGYYFLEGCGNSYYLESEILRSSMVRRVRFRGLISGREIVNTLKSRTHRERERTLLTISPQFALNDPVLHLTLILLNLAREPFQRGLAAETGRGRGRGDENNLLRNGEAKVR